MQQQTAVPAALVQTTFNFQNSVTRRAWQSRRVASPGSISEISFRTINLRAALKSGEISDCAEIRQILLELDRDLESWRVALPDSWKYIVLKHGEDSDAVFAGQTHVYSNSWIGHAWNNWRVLRILIQQQMVENEQHRPLPDNELIVRAMAVIHELSVDICISVHSFDTPSESHFPAPDLATNV
jgi:hypothetical protein